MTEKAKFEKPEIEGPLYNQLSNGSLNLWTPGIRFERIFGIDASLFSNNQYFWSLFGQSSVNIGITARVWVTIPMPLQLIKFNQI